MSNRIHNLERSIVPSRKRARTAKAESVVRGLAMSAAAPRPTTARGTAGPAITFSTSFDDGKPIVIRAPRTGRTARSASARSMSAPAPWRDVGAVSEAGFAEQLEDYDDGSSSAPVAATPVLVSDDSESARLLAEEDPAVSDDAQESRAFAAEIERLLAQANGGPVTSAPTPPSPRAQSRAQASRAPAPSRAEEPQAPPRGGNELPPDHPHRIFDQMSFATAFDGGTVDLDGIERDALPRPRKRLESFKPAAGALETIDVAEDLALIRAQNATKHYDVAADAVINADIEARIGPIADAYFAETGKNITITSGSRTPRAQAQAMYDKLQSGGDFSIYRNKTAAAEIKKAYDDAKGRGEGATQIVDAMCTVIQRQVDAGTYISRHLFAGAVDVRKRDMSSGEIAAFERAVRAQNNVSFLDEGEPPHFHLEFR